MARAVAYNNAPRAPPSAAAAAHPAPRRACAAPSLPAGSRRLRIGQPLLPWSDSSSVGADMKHRGAQDPMPILGCFLLRTHKAQSHADIRRSPCSAHQTATRMLTLTWQARRNTGAPSLRTADGSAEVLARRRAAPPGGAALVGAVQDDAPRARGAVLRDQHHAAAEEGAVQAPRRHQQRACETHFVASEATLFTSPTLTCWVARALAQVATLRRGRVVAVAQYYIIWCNRCLLCAGLQSPRSQTLTAGLRHTTGH